MYKAQADGYHPIQSVFQQISLCDTLRIDTHSDPGFELSLSDPSIPIDTNNTVSRAYETIKEQLSTGVRIHIDKQIPSGAGLGGASSNAATFLNWAKEQVSLPEQRWLEIGTSIGADVPFFMKAKTAWVEGIGEQITAIPTPVHSHYLLLFPGIHSNTAKAYAALDDWGDLADTRSQKPLPNPAEYLGPNSFESVLLDLYPKLGEIQKKAQALGTPTPQITGSGSTLFLASDSESECKKWANILEGQVNCECRLASAIV